MPVSISPNDVIDNTDKIDTYVIMYIKVSDFLNVVNSIYPNNSNLKNVLMQIPDEYITVHLNNVHIEAVKSVISNDVNRLYMLSTYNENITTYHDDYILKNINSTSCSSDTIGELLSLSYYGDVLSRMIVYDMFNYFVSNFSSPNDVQDKKVIASHISFFTECVLQSYGVYSVLDYTRETESFFISRFFIPAKENVSFHSCLGNIDDYLISIGPTDSSTPFGRNLYLFFRIARHFDGTPSGNVSRTITSYLFDNKNANLFRSIVGNNSYILEMYYDSYYGIIRDYKDYPMMIFLPDGNPNNSISLHSLPSNISMYFYNEGHIFSTSPSDTITREKDDFFVTSRQSSTSNTGGFVSFTSWLDYSTLYDQFVGYAPIDPRIKRWIMFYHDWSDGDIKHKKKFCFMFLMKMYNIKYENNKVSLYVTDTSQINSHQYFTNTDIVKEVDVLSNILRFIALYKLGFKILVYASNVSISTTSFSDEVRLKTYIPLNRKTKSDVDFFDLYYFNNFKNKDKSVFYYAGYQLYPTKKVDCVFHAYTGREDMAVNDVEFIYNMYYNNGKSYITYFNHNMSMKDFGNIISCGNLMYFISNQMYDMIPESYFLKDYLLRAGSSTNINLNLQNLKTTGNYTGGLILFHQKVVGFDMYPFVRFIDSDTYVVQKTGEPNPIFFTTNPQELDRRLYAYNLPFVLSYNPNIFDRITFGGTITMKSYTDRHKSITQKDKRLKNLQVRNGMYIHYNKSGIERYKTTTIDSNSTTLYHYYKYDKSTNSYIAITDINDIIDKKLIKTRTITDSYFANITSTVDQVFFMENIFNYVMMNINNIKIPIINEDFVYDLASYKDFRLISSGDIYKYKSIYEVIMNATSTITGTTPVNQVPEYDSDTRKYYREFLYNKYLRSMIIFVNSEIYNRVINFEEENDSTISINKDDLNVNGNVEVKTLKEVDRNQIPYIVNFNPNLNMNSKVKVANVEIRIKTIQSGIIEQTIVYFVLQ